MTDFVFISIIITACFVLIKQTEWLLRAPQPVHPPGSSLVRQFGTIHPQKPQIPTERSTQHREVKLTAWLLTYLTVWLISSVNFIYSPDQIHQLWLPLPRQHPLSNLLNPKREKYNILYL